MDKLDKPGPRVAFLIVIALAATACGSSGSDNKASDAGVASDADASGAAPCVLDQSTLGNCTL